MNYSWPGNIRELQNIIERAMIISNGPIIDVDQSLLEKDVTVDKHKSQKLEDIERTHIYDVLKQAKWTIEGNSGAAKILGLHPSTLRHRMKKLGILKNDDS